MDTIEAITTRRSVRKFQPQPVPPEEVEILLRAAMQAPSASNRQPWHFVVFDQRAHLDEIAAGHSAGQMLLSAPLAILICADEKLAKPGRWLLDCSAAMQNLLLAAHARGLGAVWVGVQPEEGRVELLRRVAGLPENIQPVGLAAIGYAAETPAQEERYRPERVHRNGW